MSNITKTNLELLDTMNGSEVQSIKYEGCVAIKRDQVISEGKVIDILNSNSKIRRLWDEFFEQEGGYNLFY